MSSLRLSCLLTLVCTSLAYPSRHEDAESNLYSDLMAELQSPTTCQESGLSNGCCTWSPGNNCYVAGGNCYCDRTCKRFNDCCRDVPPLLPCSARPLLSPPPVTPPTTPPTTPPPPPPNCVGLMGAGGGCCTGSTSQCRRIQPNGSLCYCNVGCRHEDNCCEDIDQIGCFPSNCSEAGIDLTCVPTVSSPSICRVNKSNGEHCDCGANCEFSGTMGNCCPDAAPTISPGGMFQSSQETRMKQLAELMSSYQQRSWLQALRREYLRRRYQEDHLGGMQDYGESMMERPRQYRG